MEVIKTESGEVDLSFKWRQYYRDYFKKILKKDDLPYLDSWVHKLLRVRLDGVASIIEQNGFPKPIYMRMLMAHGNCQDGIYIYFDGTESFPVQDWVSTHDGKYDALMVNSCNPEGIPASTEKSVLVYPRRVNFDNEITLAKYGMGSGILIVQPPNSFGRSAITTPIELIVTE